MAEENKINFLEYKGKALVREGNNICYGNMTDNAILYLLVLGENEYEGHKVPGKTLIQIISTDTSLPFHKRILKQGDKETLFDAFDIGCSWLQRANADGSRK